MDTEEDLVPVAVAAAATGTTIWNALEAWANTLPPWQCKIIELSVDHGRLTKDELARIYGEFLSPTTGQPVSITEPSSGSQSAIKQLVLNKIDELSGINALPETTVLTFGPGLTIIFGKNGTGKSGFVRVFANACFSRSKPPILPNVYAESVPETYSAKFHVSLSGDAQDPILFTEGEESEVLRRITVFDSAVARQHVSQAAAFEFRPRGFDVFTEMARVYGEISKLLDAEILAKTNNINFGASFLESPTEVSQMVTTLSASTDMIALRALAVFGEPERARLKAIEGQRAALRAKSPSDVTRFLKEARVDVLALQTKFNSIRDEFGEAAAGKRFSLLKASQEASASAALVGSDKFKQPFFSAVGSQEWEVFAKAAHALGKKEGATYPRDEDRCLLCERPLDDQSRSHIVALLAFVEGDAQQLAAKAKEALDYEKARLTLLELPNFSDDARVRTHINRLRPETESVVHKASQDLIAVKAKALTALGSGTAEFIVADVSAAQVGLDTLVVEIDGDLARLEAENVEASIASLDQERQVLRHRQVLSQLFPQIESQFADLKWISEASARRPGLNTRHITDKEKELFTQVVTGSYREQFSLECEALDCGVPVELQTVGRSGQTMRSLLVGGRHKPETVLSEGEQKAVALADFFTEVAMNPSAAGIVLDDPVTSQDFQRRKRIAARLVQEAANRQVIIFTHDLVFLNQLLRAAETAEIVPVTHMIQRNAEGHPGDVALGDCPDTSDAYKTTKKAMEYLARAKTTTGTARSEAIISGMGALRTTIEVTVSDKLLKGVVTRWDEQIRVGALRNMRWDDTKVEELCSLYEDLSRYIDAHSHSDEVTGGPPEITDLTQRITSTDALITWAKPNR
jgi:energy-coupling factor transporter ATP-binding protein EcfA2